MPALSFGFYMKLVVIVGLCYAVDYAVVRIFSASCDKLVGLFKPNLKLKRVLARLFTLYGSAVLRERDLVEIAHDLYLRRLACAVGKTLAADIDERLFRPIRFIDIE